MTQLAAVVVAEVASLVDCIIVRQKRADRLVQTLTALSRFSISA